MNAISYWVEVETAVGAKLDASMNIEIVAPFGVGSLFNGTVTINPNRVKPRDFKNRISSKRWLELWPELRIIDA